MISGERIIDGYLFFFGYKSPLSNFYACSDGVKCPLDNKMYKTSEHAYMVSKAIYFDDERVANQIRMSDNPGLAKQLGSTVSGFDTKEWNLVKVSIMTKIIESKFEPDHMAQYLIHTDPNIIVEANPFDKVWSIGQHFSNALPDPSTWDGKNLLGNILIAHRGHLMNNFI